MKLSLFAIPALALCFASPAAIKVSAHEAQPLPAAAPYQDRDWDRAPEGYRDPQRQGFHEGMEAARQDYADHRHADADDHRMYKHPPVEGDEARRDFREGFKEGYHRAMEHMKHERDEPHF